MAMQNTLALPELLENIISHLPERDILFNAQRVSWCWKSLINKSPTIQKKIWLQPVDQVTISPAGFEDDEYVLLNGAPIYPRTTLINPLFMARDHPSGTRQLSLEFEVRMKAMELYGKPSGFSHILPNLRMPTPRIYEHIKASNNGTTCCVPTWRTMYLSQPPVTTMMLIIPYFYQVSPDLGPTFKVMIRDKIGVTLGLVYDTLASAMPAYDESLEDSERCGSVCAHVCWYETDDDGGEDENNKDDGIGDGSSWDWSSGDSGGEDDDSGEEESVVYDSDGNVMENEGSETQGSISDESQLESAARGGRARSEEL